MARARKTQTKVCSVSGIETNVNNFYKIRIVADPITFKYWL